MYFISPKYYEGFNFNLFVQEAESLLITNKIKNPILVGHSLGGFISLYMSSRNPSYFNRIIILDSYPLYLQRLIPTITEEQARMQGDYLKRNIINKSSSQFMADQYQALKPQFTDTTLLRKVLNWQTEIDRNIIAEGMEFMISNNIIPQMKGIQSPILVINTWMPQSGIDRTKFYGLLKEQFSILPSVKLLTIEGNHFVFFEKPDKVLQGINKFIK